MVGYLRGLDGKVRVEAYGLPVEQAVDQKGQVFEVSLADYAQQLHKRPKTAAPSRPWAVLIRWALHTLSFELIEVVSLPTIYPP